MGRKILWGCIKKMNPQLQFLGVPSFVGTQVLKGIQELSEDALCHGMLYKSLLTKIAKCAKRYLRWLRKALPVLYILSLQTDIQNCLFAKSVFFS